jgi:hypothetical protein
MEISFIKSGYFTLDDRRYLLSDIQLVKLKRRRLGIEFSLRIGEEVSLQEAASMKKYMETSANFTLQSLGSKDLSEGEVIYFSGFGRINAMYLTEGCCDFQFIMDRPQPRTILGRLKAKLDSLVFPDSDEYESY